MRPIKMTKLITTLFLLLLTIGCTSKSNLKVTDLRCEYLKEPLGINTLVPRFNWKNTSKIQGTKQTAYQILVSSDINDLAENHANLWNSGKVTSSKSILVTYHGKALSPGQHLYWKIRVWDENDKASSWSDPAKFSIGLLEPSDWSASYIRFSEDIDTENTDGFQACPQFRKQFSVEKPAKQETFLLHVNSLGYHEVYINGEKVGNDVLSPAVSQFDKRSLANSYDITEYIRAGQNDLIVWLGSGWYTKGLPGVVGNGPAFKAQLEKTSSNSINKILVTDESWTVRMSEYERISNWRSGNYGGETITGNLETRNKVFETPEAFIWNTVSIIDIPEHEVTPQMVEPNRIKETINPVSIDRLNDSTFLVNMGKTITGWFEITFPILQKGQEIVMEYSDHLKDDGEIANQRQIDRYVASGNGTEQFCNKFNYHGFQYIKISNLDKSPEINKIKAHFIHTDFDSASTFVSSDKDLNDIHDMISYTLRNVGLGGYLVDCPQFERLGYGGDGNSSLISAQTMFELAPLYYNWLQAWGDVIREDGGMPHIAPNPYSAGGGPFWCGFIISAAWSSYQHYGDIRLLEEHYSVMQRWLEYVDRYSEDGLLKKWPNTDYRNWYLGDWATPTGVSNPNHEDERSVDLVNNCYISVCFRQMEDIASVLGKEDDKELYSKKRDELNKMLHKTFYDEELGYYATGSQIDIIFPMLAKVIPAELEDKLIQTLKERTEKIDNGHLNTGLVGIPVMMEWASSANQPDFIYSMLKKKTYPGYLYMIEQGATTTWEHWNGHRSRIHNCYNGVGQWFYQVVGGIRTIKGEPAYKKFIIEPQIPDGVTWAKTSQSTPRGKIEVNWELKDEKMIMEVEVPLGSTGVLHYPAGTTEVEINDEKITSTENRIELENGKYSIKYKII